VSASEERRLLVVVVAGLGFDLLERNGCVRAAGLTFRPMQPMFPGLTCPVQASLRTGLTPSVHGVTGNGLWFEDLRRPLFWEQSSRLVSGQRIWDGLRREGGRVAMLFWQQSLGESVDMLLSPMPVHKHHGGMVEAVYSKPEDLYRDVCCSAGGPFRLMRYWGPLASPASSRWIARATAAVVSGPSAPGLCLTYLPGLDYDLQRWGPDSRQAGAALRSLADDLSVILSAAKGWSVAVLGDYAIGEVKRDGAVYPNRMLRSRGWFRTRAVNGMQYSDFHLSEAFAVADHEIAYVRTSPAVTMEVAAALGGLPGVGQVLTGRDLVQAGVGHARGGQIVLLAAPGHWFAYPWWTDEREAPDYAAHVDIHNKPGYDPCELFMGWPPFTVSRNTGRIRGSHGRADADRRTAWAGTGLAAGWNPDGIAGVADCIRGWCEGK
jgi:hypothetical protein